jgi:hypothetical protein
MNFQGCDGTVCRACKKSNEVVDLGTYISEYVKNNPMPEKLVVLVDSTIYLNERRIFPSTVTPYPTYGIILKRDLMHSLHTRASCKIDFGVQGTLDVQVSDFKKLYVELNKIDGVFSLFDIKFTNILVHHMQFHNEEATLQKLKAVLKKELHGNIIPLDMFKRLITQSILTNCTNVFMYLHKYFNPCTKYETVDYMKDLMESTVCMETFRLVCDTGIVQKNAIIQYVNENKDHLFENCVVGHQVDTQLHASKLSHIKKILESP